MSYLFVLNKNLTGLYYVFILNSVLNASSSLEIVLGPWELPKIKGLNKYGFNAHCSAVGCKNCEFFKDTSSGWKMCNFRTNISNIVNHVLPVKKDDK